MNTTFHISTIADLRKDFWRTYPQFKRRMIRAGRAPNGRLLYRHATQNEYDATIRTYWVGYVDCMERAGLIPTRLAESATL